MIDRSWTRIANGPRANHKSDPVINLENVQQESDRNPTGSRHKVGVLVANLGTPDGTDYWSMRRYLSEFLSDPRVIDYPRWKWQPILQAIILSKRPFTSGAAYRSVWNTDANESPLMTITKAQTAKLRERLSATYDDAIIIDFSMRYGNPSTPDVVARMVNAGCDRMLFFPLYPQYAGATTATANDAFFRSLTRLKIPPASRTAPPYFDRPDYIEALAQSVEQSTAAQGEPDALVCSFHGLPQRYVDNGDPYDHQCRQTTNLLMNRLGWDDQRITTTFQSKFGREEWLKPATVEEVARLAMAGKKNIAVIAPGFSADCLETLEEINGEIRESFVRGGGERFTYIPCLNDDDAHISALVAVIEENLAGWL